MKLADDGVEKMLKSYHFKKVAFGVTGGASMLALAAALSLALPIALPTETGSVAFAQHGGGGQGKGGGGQGKGGGGHSDGGHDDGGHDDSDDSGHEEPEGHSGKSGKQAKGGGAVGGKGGPSADSEGKGPRAGTAGGSKGTRPVWAQEGIPEVELGRLNVARSPDRILAKAAAEEVANLTPEKAVFYSQSLKDMLTALRTDFENVSMIDSPVANLGLLKDVLDGKSVLSEKGVENSPEVLAAVFLGTASDKTVEISPETAYAVSKILGFELDEKQSEALANDAEDIREAILEGHG